MRPWTPRPYHNVAIRPIIAPTGILSAHAAAAAGGVTDSAASRSGPAHAHGGLSRPANRSCPRSTSMPVYAAWHAVSTGPHVFSHARLAPAPVLSPRPFSPARMSPASPLRRSRRPARIRVKVQGLDRYAYKAFISLLSQERRLFNRDIIRETAASYDRY